MIFAYIKTLDNFHKAPCSCIICLGKESMLCVCGCSSGTYCLPIGWITSGYLDLVQRLEFGVDHLQKNAVYQIE